MEWAVAYAATVLSLAYAVPKVLIVVLQAQMVTAQLDAMTPEMSEGTGTVPFEFNGDNGGYA